jgi:integrase
MLRKTLTALSVERVKPPARGQIEHFDQGFPGLALRVSYGGSKSWVFFYRHGGRLRRMTLGTYPALALSEARDAWREARRDVARGVDPALAYKRGKTSTNFAAVLDDWLKRDQANNKSLHNVTRIVHRELLPAWGHRPVSEIGRRDVLDLLDAIADRPAPVMARRVHAHTHRLFKWAVGRGIIAANPAADLPQAGAVVSRDRVLTDVELAAVWHGAAALGGPVGSALQLLILTGARREEIGALRWDEMCGDHILLANDRTKSGKPHTIPLSAPARALIERQPHVTGRTYVFTSRGTSPVTSWAKAKTRLDSSIKIAPWRTHDLRRTTATGLQKIGVSLQTIEAVLGHTSGSRSGVVATYQRHSFDSEKRAALEAWGAHVMALVEGRAPGTVLPIRGVRL